MVEPFEYDVFISFSSADEEIVKPIWQILSSNGLRVFWSDSTLKKEVGNSWFDVIEKSLEQSKHMLLVCSENSMSSKWVQREYRAFFDHCYSPNWRRLIPLLTSGFKPNSLPLFLRELQVGKIDDPDFLQEIISILGGVNIEKLRHENQLLREQVNTLLQENNLLRERLASGRENNVVPMPEVESPVSTTTAYEILGLSESATSQQIRERYELLHNEYSRLGMISPAKLQLAYQAKLEKIENAFSAIYSQKKEFEEQQIIEAFDFLQLEVNSSRQEIIDKFLVLKKAYEDALSSPDNEIRELAKEELAKAETVIKILLPDQDFSSSYLSPLARRDKKTSVQLLSPVAKKIVEANKISAEELNTIRGTGGAGRITSTDLLNYLEKRRQ